MVNVSVSQIKSNARSVAQINREKRIEADNERIVAENEADDITYEEAQRSKPVFEEKIGGATQYVNKLNDWLTKYGGVLGKGEDRFKETSQFLEQQNTSIKSRTYTGKDIKQLAKQTNLYDVEYYSSGAIKSIKSKPRTFESSKKKGRKRSGKRLDKEIRSSSIIDYEVNLREDGTLKSEIQRADAKTLDYDRWTKGSSWSRSTTERTAFDDLTVQYDVKGNVSKVIDKEAEAFSKRRGDKSNKYEYKIVDRKVDDFEKGESIFTPKARVRTDRKTTRPTPVTTTKKFTVTASNLFGTSNNKLRQGEREIVNPVSRKEILKKSGLTPSEITELKKTNPKVLEKVIQDTKSRLQGQPTSTQKRFTDIKERQYGESIKQELQSKGSVVFSSNGQSLIAEGKLTKNKKFEQEVTSIRFQGRTPEQVGESTYSFYRKEAGAVGYVKDITREAKFSFKAKNFEGKAGVFLNAPVVSEIGAASFLAMESVGRAGKGLYNVGKFTVENPKEAAVNVLKFNNVLTSARYKTTDYLKGVFTNPVETYKKTAPVVVAGGVAAGVFASKTYTYIKENPRDATIKAGAFVIEAYTYGKVLQGVGKAGKFTKNVFSKNTFKAFGRSKVATFKPRGSTPKKSLRSRKPIRKAELSKQSRNRAYDPRITSNQGDIIVNRNKGLQFRVNPLKSTIQRIAKKRGVKVVSELNTETRQKTIDILARRGTVPKTSKLYRFQRSQSIQRGKPKGVIEIVSNKGGKQITSVQQVTGTSQNELFRLTQRRIPSPAKATGTGQNQLLTLDKKNVVDKVKAASSLKRVPAPAKSEAIKGFRGGKSTQRLFKKLAAQKEQRLKYFAEQKSLDGSTRSIIVSAPRSPTVVNEVKNLDTVLKKDGFGILNPAKKKVKYKLVDEIAYNRPEALADLRRGSTTFNPLTEQSKIVNVYNIGGVYNTPAGIVKDVVSQTGQGIIGVGKDLGAGSVIIPLKGILNGNTDETAKTYYYVSGIKSELSINIGSTTGTDNIIGTKQDIRTDSAIDTSYDSSYLSDSKSDTDYATAIKQDLKIQTTPSLLTATKTALSKQQTINDVFKPRKPVKQPKTKLYNPKFRDIFKPNQKITEEPIPKLGTIGFFSGIKNKSLFDVEVRRKGEFSSVRPRGFSSLQAAFSTGIKQTKNTAAASFRIKEKRTGKILTNLGIKLGREYRPSKREAGVIIQKRSFRIGTAGEKQEITKKGLFALKIKKGKKNIFGGY